MTSPFPPSTAPRSSHADSIKTTLSLDASLAARLRGRALTAYSSRVDELLLTALLRALRRLTGGRVVSVALEGHGRDPELAGELDLGRTVGWFTTLSPVSIALSEREDVALDVKQTKEAVRTRGKGMPELERWPEIAFNFVDETAPPSELSPFALIDDVAVGALIAPAAPRWFDLAVLITLRPGGITLELDADSGRLPVEFLPALSPAFAAELELVLSHCERQEGVEFTPSDVDLPMTLDELDDVLSGIG